MKLYKIFVNAREYYTSSRDESCPFDDIPTVEVETVLSNCVASFMEKFLEELDLKDQGYVVQFSRFSYLGPYMEVNEKLIDKEHIYAVIYKK